MSDGVMKKFPPAALWSDVCVCGRDFVCFLISPLFPADSDLIIGELGSDASRAPVQRQVKGLRSLV